MEGENNFLIFLPQAARIRERDNWYREVDDEVKAFLTLPYFEAETEPAIAFQTDDEKTELFGMLARHLNKVLPVRHSMAAIKNGAVRAAGRQPRHLNARRYVRQDPRNVR
jgi:hypothetical protein